MFTSIYFDGTAFSAQKLFSKFSDQLKIISWNSLYPSDHLHQHTLNSEVGCYPLLHAIVWGVGR